MDNVMSEREYIQEEFGVVGVALEEILRLRAEARLKDTLRDALTTEIERLRAARSDNGR